MALFTTAALVREKARQVLESQDWTDAQINTRIGEVADEMLLSLQEHFPAYMTTSSWLLDPPVAASNTPPYVVQTIATIWTVGKCLLDAYSTQMEANEVGSAMIRKAQAMLANLCRAGTVRLRDGTTVTGSTNEAKVADWSEDDTPDEGYEIPYTGDDVDKWYDAE